MFFQSSSFVAQNTEGYNLKQISNNLQGIGLFLKNIYNTRDKISGKLPKRP
jgi:hypothetical protein